MRNFLALVFALLAGAVNAAPPTCWPSNIGGNGGEATYSLVNRVGPYVGWHCPDSTDWLYAVRQGDVSDELGKALNAALSASDRQAAATGLLPFAARSRTDVFDVWQSVASWKPVVAEGGGVHLSNPAAGAVIRYGADTRWIIKPVYGDIACTNAGFGTDPAFGAAKGCEQAVFVGKAIPVAAPVYTHRVKGPGTCDAAGVCTRPLYTLSGATLTLAKGRGVVAQPCNVTHPTKASGSDLYAEFGPAFAPGVVALCSKD